jgi:23S rRNA (uracil1939-C5)-methyltransferase
MTKKIKIDKVTYKGYGLGYDENGKVAFVPYCLPEEEVEVKIIEDYKDYFVCEPVELIKKSNYRVEPKCKIFEKCGGCDFLNIEYDYEITLKKEILKEIFFRNHVHFNFDLLEVIKSPSRYFYRNNAQLKVSEKGEIGFFKERSLKVIPFPERKCLFLTQKINDFLENINDDSLLFTKGFRIRDGEEIFLKGLKGYQDNEKAIYKVNGYIYELDIDGFFQVNNFTNPFFLNKVLDLIPEGIYNNFVELFCGVGFFSIPIFNEKKIKNYFASEISKKAISYAKTNNILNNSNVSFYAIDSEIFLENYENIDAVFVDPPRSGLTSRLIKNIIDKKIKDIYYISCNPTTYLRDIKILLENKYEIEKLILLDNFPATYHFEIISKLILR